MKKVVGKKKSKQTGWVGMLLASVLFLAIGFPKGRITVDRTSPNAPYAPKHEAAEQTLPATLVAVEADTKANVAELNQALFAAIESESIVPVNNTLVKREREVTVNQAALSGGIFEFNPFPGYNLQVVPKQVQKQDHEQGTQIQSLYGEITDDSGAVLGFASLTALSTPTGIAYSGAFTMHSGTSFTLRHREDGASIIDEINSTELPDCPTDAAEGTTFHHTEIASADTAADSPHPASATMQEAYSGTNLTPITVMIVYTPEARIGAGGVAAIEARGIQAVNDANTSYQNSGINIRLTLVHMQEVTYTESGSFNTDLYRLTLPTDGHMDNVHTLRDQYGADMVSLLVNNMQYCGLGWLGSAAPWAQHYMFTVTNQYCAAYLTFAHELGHNMGANHNIANAGGQGAYPYSYGHHMNNGRLRTVMSYAPGVRVPHFSNPNVSYLGYPTGIANQADNARTLNNTAATIAGFRGSSFSISGFITDNGTAVSGATVSAGPLGTRITDVNGFYQFNNINEGSIYALTVSKNGYAFTPETANGVLSDDATHDFAVVSVNAAPELAQIADQQMTAGETDLSIPLSATDADNDTITFTASLLTVGGDAASWELKEQYGFVSFKKHKQGNVVMKVTLKSDEQKNYELTRKGDLFLIQGKRKIFQERINKNYFNQPRLLVQATPPAEDNVALSVSGDVLNIQRTETYSGTLRILVVASDGSLTDSQQFTVLAIE